jgi:hypothetical protein
VVAGARRARSRNALSRGPGLLALGSRRSQGLCIGEDTRPFVRRSASTHPREMEDETASGRAQTSCARQHPFAGEPTVGCPFDGHARALPRYLAPLVALRRRVGSVATGEPTVTSPPATLVSSRRPERARSLASTSANDGCLVHPVSHFESRASVAFLAVGSSPPGGGEAPLEGWDDSCPPAPRDRRRSRERSRSMGDGPRHIELSLRRDSGSWLDGQ